MSGVPNLCVDIFSQMGNLLRNFHANAQANGDTFSMENGFQTRTPEPTSGGSFEQTLNEVAGMAMIGLMIAFLLVSQFNNYSGRQHNVKPARTATPGGDFGGSGPGGVH